MIRYDDGKVGEIWLSTIQKDVIWKARDVDPETVWARDRISSNWLTIVIAPTR